VEGKILIGDQMSDVALYEAVVRGDSEGVQEALRSGAQVKYSSGKWKWWLLEPPLPGSSTPYEGWLNCLALLYKAGSGAPFNGFQLSRTEDGLIDLEGMLTQAPAIEGDLREWRERHPGALVANLAGRDDLTDANLVHLKGVLVVCLMGCPLITDIGLGHLSGAHTLVLAILPGITDAAFSKHTDLHTLIIAQCPITSAAFIRHLGGLHTLDLDSCHSVTDEAFLHLPSLHTLSVRMCAEITGCNFEALVGIERIDINGSTIYCAGRQSAFSPRESEGGRGENTTEYSELAAASGDIKTRPTNTAVSSSHEVLSSGIPHNVDMISKDEVSVQQNTPTSIQDHHHHLNSTTFLQALPISREIDVISSKHFRVDNTDPNSQVSEEHFTASHTGSPPSHFLPQVQGNVSPPSLKHRSTSSTKAPAQTLEDTFSSHKSELGSQTAKWDNVPLLMGQSAVALSSEIEQSKETLGKLTARVEALSKILQEKSRPALRFVPRPLGCPAPLSTAYVSPERIKAVVGLELENSRKRVLRLWMSRLSDLTAESSQK